MTPITIIGSGLAGYTVARELRKYDKTSRLRILTRDDGRFYSKPMLSNALARGQSPDQLANAAAEAMADQLHAEVRTYSEVQAIDPAARSLRVDGRELPYRDLVLAVGADPIRLPLEGDGAGEVLSVNDLSDYTAFRERIAGARRVAVLGAGLIGCEFANDLRAAGLEVDVIDLAPAPLGRLVPPEAGEALRDALADLGVRWHLDTRVAAVERDGAGLRVRLTDGSEVAADAMLSAVGLRPRTGLARDAGLEVERGVVVDRFLRASADGVYALGDCAEVQGLVLPFVMPLMNAGRALGRILAGAPSAVVYPAMPVVVKTPAHPVVVCPPPPGVSGEWQASRDANGVRAVFNDPHGRMRGFTLTGAYTGEKTALAGQLPPLLNDEG